ncbi:MAG TPA: hypothetical protein VJR89_34185 [Polyangiales bacterium]|nr:hypothetical protein [Polyangiales bacterium]
MTARIPAPNDIVWTGPARDTHWRVRFIGAIVDTSEEDELMPADTSTPSWRVRFESESGESFVRTWAPQQRILFGSLPGWSRSAIASLKRALITLQRD